MAACASAATVSATMSSCRSLLQTARLHVGAASGSRFVPLWPVAVASSVDGPDLLMKYEAGLPTVAVPLPSRSEMCRFTLKPVTHTTGDFCEHIRREDRGVDFVALYRDDDSRISQSTPVEQLLVLESGAWLRINDTRYRLVPDMPPDGAIAEERVKQMDDLRNMVANLSTLLQVDEHQVQMERKLIAKREEILAELEPMQKLKETLDQESRKRVNRLHWIGLSLMGIQTGLFARLTWWEYSWDIMEPVTYFATYSALMGVAAYYVVTKQSYEYHEASDRMWLKSFHRAAQRRSLDIARFNELRRQLVQVDAALAEIRSPLQLRLPRSRLRRLQAAGAMPDVPVEV